VGLLMTAGVVPTVGLVPAGMSLPFLSFDF
jgi:hypothetical protein